MEEIILEFKEIDKSFPGVKALDKVSFAVFKGTVHAVVGENGAGKSTLMNILAGVLKKDGGKIYFNGENIEIIDERHANNLGISIVYQERSLMSNINIAENIFVGRQPVNGFGHINKGKLFKETEFLLKKLNLNLKPNQLVGTLSPAEQQMVEIAKALSLKVSLLILDEPTSAITENETKLLFKIINELKKSGISVIFISHRLAEVFEIADSVTVLKDGKYMATKPVKDTNIDELIKLMVGRELEKVTTSKCFTEDIILEIKNFSSNKFTDINFFLKKGEILSFAGLAGAGRTEVMRSIFGVDKRISGEVYINNKKVEINSPSDAISYGLGYLPEDRKEQALFLGMSIFSNIAIGNFDKFANPFYVNDKKIIQVSNDYKDKLNISTPNIHRRVINLSGGNQQKVVLARWLVLRPNILIADEPTRGVDVGARVEIYKIIEDMVNSGISVIIVSSDLTEVLSISNRIIVMCEGSIAGVLNVDDADEEKIIHLASINDKSMTQNYKNL